MKNLKILFALIILLCNSADLSAQFRNSTWGMSIEQVELIEGKPYIESETALAYKTIEAGLGALAVYVFAEGKLVRAAYTFTENHLDTSQYLLKYVKVREILKRKYGEPLATKQYWSNDLYDPYGETADQIMLAIISGHLELRDTWYTKDTKIHNIIRDENRRVKHIIEFVSREWGHLEKN